MLKGLTHLVCKPVLVRTAVSGLHIEKLPCSPHHITKVLSASAPHGANKNVTSWPDSSHSIYSNK